MLIIKTIKTKWNSKTMKYYIEKGYVYNKGDMGKEFEVKVEDLKKYSREVIKVRCDYNEDGCETEVEKIYSDYLESHRIIEKDCCNNEKCKQKKLEESVLYKYGETNISKTDYFKEKYKEVMQQNYGVDNYFALSPFSGENNYGYKDTYIICKNCGKKIHRKESWIKKNETHFCSRECKHNFLKKISKTPQNLKVRRSGIYKHWRNAVLEKDNYTCQCCGRKDKLEAHHINNFSNNEELRLNISNGITLCFYCHGITAYGSFHNLYGGSNNNREQLEEYILRYNSGEIDEIRRHRFEILNSYTYKECSSCKNVYPKTEEYFHKDKYSSDGLTYQCKECRNKNK